MSKKWISFILILIAIVFLLSVLIIFLWNEQMGSLNNESAQEANFEKTGTLVMDNPGYPQGELVFVYDEPGAPASLVTIAFDPEAECLVQGTEVVCALDAFTNGSRAHVTGFIQETEVRATSIIVVEVAEPEEQPDLILERPAPNAVVSSPIQIGGEARGTWFFEATFPIELQDTQGTVLAQGYATTLDDWMTEDYVSFSALLEYSAPDVQNAILILEKANPSGLPEHADSVEVPVRLTRDTIEEITLYFYNPLEDTDDDGMILCSQEGVVAVERTIVKQESRIRSIAEAVNLLLEGQITTAESAQGITTEFPLDDFELVNVELFDGIATLTFDDPNNATSGGSCRANILWAQIEQTVLEFAGVEEVHFEPEELFQP